MRTPDMSTPATRWRHVGAMLVAPLLLVACSSSGSGAGDEDAAQLNEAAAMLDANSVDANAATLTDNESDPQ